MTKEQIAAKLQAIIVDQMGCEEDEVTTEARFTEDILCDSLDGIELIMAVEEEFEIEIPDEDGPENLTTVQAAVDYIHGKIG